MRALRLAVVTVLFAGLASPALAARADRTAYERALARERQLTARASQDQPAEAELRSVSVAFENVTRRYPTSGYADNALLKAAAIAEQLHQRFHREADAKRALTLYQWLAKEYPSSPLVKQALASASALEGGTRAPSKRTVPSNAPVPEAPASASRPQPTSDVASVPAPATERGAAVVPADTRAAAEPPGAAAASTPGPGAARRLREVRRAVLPELVRVTLELDGEVPYQHERIEGPPRLFFDLKGVQPAPTLQDAVLTWPDDVVRQVRMGRQPQKTTRVVLDLDGVSRYSVFTLYNPFRVVVDLERRSGKRVGAVPRVPAPVVRVEATALESEPGVPAGPVSRPSTPPSLPQAAGAVDLRSETAVPVATRSVAPEAPGQSGAGADGLTDASPTDTHRRLTPEQPIASRDIDLVPLSTARGSPAKTGDTVASESAGSSPAAAPLKAPAKSASRKPAASGSKPRTAKAAPLPSPPGPASAGTPQTSVADAAAAPAVPAPASELPAAQVAAPPVVTTPAGLTAWASAAGTVSGTAVEVSPSGAAAGDIAPRTPQANAAGGFSMARQLGLGVSRIVIDPGHGGRDPGALGKNVGEAELVLDVALRLEKLLLKQPGMEVVLTRRTDAFVPLEERTEIANRQQADLFLSIHANASRNAKARGIETYFLNFASTPDAEAVAARENSASARTMHNLPDIVRAIALNTKLDESRDFAHMVQDALVKRLSGQNRQLRNLGVKQAPFVVLIGAAMPSVLAEISFVTHPQEAQLLRSKGYRQRIAEALHDAVLKYQRSLKAVSTVARQ